MQRSVQSARLSLEDLVDLEMQLQVDRDRDSHDLRRRDAEIGQKIDAQRLVEKGDDRRLFLAWLKDVRTEADPHQPSPGRQVKLFLEIVGLVLAIFGLSLGFGAVTGWLRMDPTEPVNAVFFWSVIIGVQILLLGVWVVAILPASWLGVLPGAEAFQMLLRLVARALPLIVAWLATRISPEHRVLLGRVRGTLQSWSWVYGKIRFWKLVGLTQVFAVAYNVGAILAFVGISYGNDPAFGWKSRLLTPEALHRIVQILSAPWSWAWPAAAPTLEHIHLTRYSSLDPRYREMFESRGGEVDAWVLWWPFLLACLIFYGLGPRLVTLLIAQWQSRRALARVKLDHGDFYKLKDRLTRPLVETQALKPELGDEPKASPPAQGATVAPQVRSPEIRQNVDPAWREPPTRQNISPVSETPAPSSKTETPQPVRSAPRAQRTVVRWAGVNLSRDDLAALVRKRLGVETADVHTVGDLQGKGDEMTLAALENDGEGEVLMVVESWEPPIADYVDFLTDLRHAVGRERMIVVLLYNRDAQGSPSPSRPQDVRVWRDQIAAMGDPWMCVEELVEIAPQEADASM
jgi:hypothetical protein